MKTFWNKKIPTFLGLLLLVVAVLATSYLVNTGVIYFGKAAPSENPKDVRITNVSDTSLTITYKTQAQVIGTASLGTDKNSLQVVLDDRDQLSGAPKQYFLHSISIKNLKPETAYVFSITSGTTTYQNGQDLFSAQTGKIITATPSSAMPFTGKVIEPDGSNPNEALIYVTTAGAQTISTLVKTNGVYLLPLNALRTTDNTNYFQLQNNTTLQVLATDGKNESQGQIASSISPVPLITLGNNYNFLTSEKPIASTAASLGFPPFPQGNLTATPIISVPQKDQGFSDTQPRFSGKALPNQQVTIEIHSNNAITATVTTDASGNWTYRPTAPLSPGQHTISITSKNSAGILQTIEQSFVVFASGSTVTQTATPSSQVQTIITSTPTPTLAPTSVPTLAATTTPTLTSTTGATTTRVVITPTPTIIVTPRPTLPPTGNNSLIFSSILAIATAAIGVVLFFFTRGATL